MGRDTCDFDPQLPVWDLVGDTGPETSTQNLPPRHVEYLQLKHLKNFTSHGDHGDTCTFCPARTPESFECLCLNDTHTKSTPWDLAKTQLSVFS